MENIFKIVERKRNHWEEHKYNSNKDKYRKCIKNNKPFRGIIYWKRI